MKTLEGGASEEGVVLWGRSVFRDWCNRPNHWLRARSQMAKGSSEPLREQVSHLLASPRYRSNSVKLRRGENLHAKWLLWRTSEWTPLEWNRRRAGQAGKLIFNEVGKRPLLVLWRTWHVEGSSELSQIEARKLSLSSPVFNEGCFQEEVRTLILESVSH